MKLLHKVLPEKANSAVLASIARYGLLPQLPSEYRASLPTYLQKVPIVWLTERLNTMDGVVFSVDTDKLGREKLHALDWDSVSWWVYEGIISPELLEREPLMEEQRNV